MATSSSWRLVSNPNLYLKPEQPPPSTLMRSIDPAGSLPRICAIRRAALSLTETVMGNAVPETLLLESRYEIRQVNDKRLDAEADRFSYTPIVNGEYCPFGIGRG